MDLGLKDKIVIITGGSTGIGCATARAFAKEGAVVTICGRQQDKLDKMIADSASMGLTIHGRSVDVSKEKELKAFIEGVGEKYGRIDVLFNNAGCGMNTYFMDLPRDWWDYLINTNLTAVWLGTKYAVPYMRRAGGGSVVSTSSLSARMSTTARSVYAVTKAGVSTFTTLMASELAADHIRVNAVAPGVIMSEMLKEGIKNPDWSAEYIARTAIMQRIGEPEELANVVLFLCSNMASYITGETLDVSGGKFRVQDPWCSWEKKKREQEANPVP